MTPSDSLAERVRLPALSWANDRLLPMDWLSALSLPSLIMIKRVGKLRRDLARREEKPLGRQAAKAIR